MFRIDDCNLGFLLVLLCLKSVEVRFGRLSGTMRIDWKDNQCRPKVVSCFLGLLEHPF